MNEISTQKKPHKKRYETILLKVGEITDRTSALLTIPFYLIRDLVHKICNLNTQELAQERQERADHESGHVLILIIENIPILRIKIGKLRDDTYRALSRALGNKVPSSGGVRIADDSRRQLQENSPHGNVLMCLAGLAATLKKYANWQSIVEQRLQKENLRNEWEDIRIPYHALTEATKKIIGREPTEQEMQSIFMAVLEALSTLFAKPQFQKSLTVISKHIMDNDYEAAKDQMNMRQILVQEGITENEFIDMQRAIQNISIEEIIRSQFQITE